MIPVVRRAALSKFLRAQGASAEEAAGNKKGRRHAASLSPLIRRGLELEAEPSNELKHASAQSAGRAAEIRAGDVSAGASEPEWPQVKFVKDVERIGLEFKAGVLAEY